ncbi:MAG: acyl-CoA reductase [Flavobacteriales bacterium]|nr:acyl-CoA reductase [Flavobacteriales bacterium]
MSLEKRINAFVELGSFLTQYSSKHQHEALESLNQQFFSDFDILMNNQKPFNGWFTPDNVAFAVESIAKMLRKEELHQWLSNYTINDHTKPKRVGVVMAGNIPLVGFHDFLTVLITGNVLVAKASKEDNLLIKKIAEILIAIEPDFKSKIVFTDKLENFDAVIATGSNNTARYFEYYFGKYPNIIRKNRNSVAVLTGNETAADMMNLGKDIFQYFGLGCRNVSKLYVPKNYSFNLFFESIVNDYKHVVENNKYANNYDYNKAVYLLGSNQLLDNNFVLLKEAESLSSPVAVVHYEYYNSLNEVTTLLENKKEEIQCVVTEANLPNVFKLGQAQQPTLWDYADGVDTVEFLLRL